MAAIIQLKGMRGLVRVGVPADPTQGASSSEYVLTVQHIIDLVGTPELFFSTNPSFEVLRPTTDKALQTLLKAGIINPTGTKPRRRGGCRGCSRRRLVAFALQFSAHFQTIILRAQEDESIKIALARDLRSYIQRKSPDELKEGTPLVLYARLKNSEIRKVVI